jgi:hypothetical protein
MATTTHLKKGSKVVLENKQLGKSEFGPEQAQNLLTMPKFIGIWTLPADSKYKLENGKLISSRTSGKNSSPKE